MLDSRFGKMKIMSDIIKNGVGNEGKWNGLA